MKITVACESAEYYSAIKNAGFDGIDFSFAPYDKRDHILSERYTGEIASSFAALQQMGLRVFQTHLTYYPGHIPPIGNGTYGDFEDYMLPILEREIELTAALGCGCAVIHLYFEKDREKSRSGNVSLISKLIPTLQKHGVVLAVENIYGPDYSDAHLSAAEDLAYYADHFGDDCVGVCLDTGHAIIRGQCPADMLAVLGDRLKAVHLHTTVLQIDLHSIPYCTSYGESIDWREFYDKLCEIGYGGTFNLEVRPPENISNAAVDAYYKLAYEVAKCIAHGQKN